VNKLSFRSKLRLTSGVFLLVIIVLFACLKIVPLGHSSYYRSWPDHFLFGGGFIDNFQPGERIDSSDRADLKIISDPVYFSFFSPRRFDKARVTVKYRDVLPSSTPIVELGVLKDKLSGAYEFKPIQNSLIDERRFSWHRLIDENGLVILQKDENYSSSSIFLSDLAAKKLVGCQGGQLSCAIFYNYPITPSYSLPSYISSKPLAFSQSLLGPHKFYSYVAEKSWRYSFSFSELEGKEDDDNLATVDIYQDGRLIASASSSVPGMVNLTGNGKPGLYRVEIKISNDVAIEKISASSDRLSFIGHIQLIGDGSLQSFFTDASHISATAFAAESLGRISFSGREYELEKTHESLVMSSGSEKIKEIRLEKGGVVIEGDGMFSFDKESFFNPETKKLGRFSIPEDYMYIVSAYDSPEADGEFKVASVDFDLSNAYREDGKYSFVISIPGLDQDKGYSGDVLHNNFLEIEEIRIEAEGKSVYQKIWEILGTKK